MPYNIAANLKAIDPFGAAQKRRALDQTYEFNELKMEGLQQEIDAAPAIAAAAQRKEQRDENVDRRAEEEAQRKDQEWLFGIVADAAAAGLEEKESSGDGEKAFGAMNDHLRRALPPGRYEELRPEMGDTWDQDEVESLVASAEEYRLKNRPEKKGKPSALVNMYNPETGERMAVRPDSPEADEAAANGFLVGGTSKEMLGLDEDSATGELKAADESFILRMVGQYFGGLFDEATGQFNILDPTKRRKAAQIVEAASAHLVSGAAKTRAQAVKMGMKAYGEEWEEPEEAEDSSQYEIGDIIEKGGKKWEIIGFEDEEPLVREVG